jgi:site-specific DNA-methyltransferase (adenine-specific)
MKFKNGVLYNEDVLNLKLNNEVDLIVTSPPYNLSIDYENSNDAMMFDDYMKWCEKWFKICYDSLKDDGRMFINIPLKITQPHDKKVNIPLVKEYLSYLLNIGFGFNNIIIWDKGNINKTCWGSFKSASSPFIRDPAESIIVLYKKRWDKINKKGINDIDNEEFVKWTQNVWKFGTERRKNNEHPAPFPIELPYRCIKLFSYVNDVIFDPFMGSGTTAIAAEKLNRKWIGCEISKTYYEYSVKRISDSIGINIDSFFE